MKPSPAVLIANFLAAIDLMDFSIALMRQNIARRLPGALDEEIDRELRRWLIEQPDCFRLKSKTLIVPTATDYQ